VWKERSVDTFDDGDDASLRPGAAAADAAAADDETQQDNFVAGDDENNVPISEMDPYADKESDPSLGGTGDLTAMAEVSSRDDVPSDNGGGGGGGGGGVAHGLGPSKARALKLEPQVHPRNPGTFAFQRTTAGVCGYLCKTIKGLGFHNVGSLNAPALRMIRWYDYKKWRHLQNTVINQVGSDSSCIGGGKGKQLRCRQQLAAGAGCSYATLPVQARAPPLPRAWALPAALRSAPRMVFPAPFAEPSAASALHHHVPVCAARAVPAVPAARAARAAREARNPRSGI